MLNNFSLLARDKWAAASLAACLLIVASGCSSPEPKGDPLGKLRLRLQTPVAAYGFEESSGNAVTDNSGNGHNSTLAGQTRVAGKYGSALDFSDNYLTIADSNLLDLRTGMTLSAWVWPEEDQESAWLSVIYKEGPAQAVYGLDASSPFQGRPPVTFLDSGSADAFAYPEVEEDELAELPKLTWSHLAATYDGATLRLWINGDQAASTPFSQQILVSSRPLRLGGTALFDEFFRGKIDEVRIYDRALTEDEIEHDLHRPVNPSGPETTAPSVSLSAPSNGGKVAGKVPLTATASDNVSVAGVKFYVDGTAIGEDEWPPFEITWNATALANGNHTIRAEARDAAGNLGSSSTITVGLINNSLVAAYNFNEGSGAVLHDVTGNGNDGALDGQAWVAGKYGQALEFDETFVTVPDAQVLDLDRMTLSAWVKPKIQQFNWPTIVLKENPGLGLAYSLYSGWEDHPPSICIAAVEENDCVHGGATPQNVWTHLAGTYDGSVFRMYVNGNLAATSTPEFAPPAVTTGALRIGANAIWENENFDGLIDDLRIYNYALSETQIEQDMATPVTGGGCGSGCGDGNVCNGVETCVSGSCLSGTPPTVDDQNPCTTDACHPTNGVTHTNVANGTACNDGNACTLTDSCQTGACIGANPVTCNAQDNCHEVGSCNPATGLCSNPAKPNGASCSDGNACTQTDACQGGTCAGSNPVVCSAPDQCHDTGTCNPTTGQCSNVPKPNGAVCSDGNACTQGDQCQGGVCQGGPPSNCPPPDQCHSVASCNPATGTCTYAPLADGTPCNDASVCTSNDSCTSGACAGLPVNVDDSNVCTSDGCDAVSGVFHTPVPAGSDCGSAGRCAAPGTCNASGTCIPGQLLETDDRNPCTIDACDPLEAGVTHQIVPGLGCADTTICNGAEACDAQGVCQPGVPLTLDDGNPCTDDSCHPVHGVAHIARSAGDSCSDGNPCNGSERCNGFGVCASEEPDFSDDNPCTIDSCDPATGVVHAPAPPGSSCSDGNACNGDETCDVAGACAPGPAPVLDDGNACTTDSCDPSLGVAHTPIPVEDDGSPCTEDACDPASGMQHRPLDSGVPCGDGDACNGDERCDGYGTCVPGVAPELRDDNPCTLDFCDQALGVRHEIELAGTACALEGIACGGAGTCDESGSCIFSERPTPTNDGNPCTVDVCDRVTGTVTHVPEPVGAPCDDGDPCNGGADVCDVGGNCVAAGAVAGIDDGNACTRDACQPGAGVVHVAEPPGTPCGARSDGALCASAGSCDGLGACISAAVPIDDGNPCTADDCITESGRVEHLPEPAGKACDDGNVCNGSHDVCDGAGACTASSSGPELDDHNPCTRDTCALPSGIVHAPEPAGTPCGTRLACDGAGNCRGTTPPRCEDFCDALSGRCEWFDNSRIERCENDCALREESLCGVEYQAMVNCFMTTGPPVQLCDDANPTLSGCSAESNAYRTCVSSCGNMPADPLGQVLGDGLSSPCSIVKCDVASGGGRVQVIEDMPEGTPCERLDICGGQGHCNGTGSCSIGEPLPDGTPCPGAGCGGPGVCEAGECQASEPELDPGPNGCTEDHCPVPIGPCRDCRLHTALPAGTACDLGPCYEAESCDDFGRCAGRVRPSGAPCNSASVCGGQCDGAGRCLATAPSDTIDDGNPCTLDACDATTGSVSHSPVAAGTSCEDDTICNGTAERCDADARCLPTVPPPTIDDNNPCTFDHCTPEFVAHDTLPFGTPCDDATRCNGREACNSIRQCVTFFPAPNPNDNNPCTVDSCDPVLGEVHTPSPAGTSCDDANPCTGSDACDGAGACAVSVPVSVDDGNACTADSCTPSTGVTHVPVEVSDDQNPCTTDFCDPVAGTLHLPRPAGSACSDQNPCNGEELCDAAGSCLAGTPIALDDGNPCTIDTCDALGGVSHPPAPGGTACADQDLCNGHETCDGLGNCAAGVPPPIDDANPCTDDSCDPALGVEHVSRGDPQCIDVNSTWRPLTPSRPSPRDSAAVAFDVASQRMVLFGGENAGAALGDTWIWDGSTELWALSNASGPSARAGAAMAYDAARGRLVMFGGVAGPNPGGYQGDLWEYDPIGDAWQRRATTGTVPEPRAYAAMAYDVFADRILLFGGTGSTDFADTWEWSGATGVWSRHSMPGPSPRGGAKMVYDPARRRFVLFGGGALANASGVAFNDTWELDGATGVWSERSAASPPSARTAHAMTYDAQLARVVLHGGTDASRQALDDLWLYDGSTGSWSAVPAASLGPRAGHALAFDATSGNTLAAGGLIYSASGQSTPAFADVQAYDAESGTWSERTADRAPAVVLSGAVYDTARSRIVVRSSVPRMSMWELDARAGSWDVNDAFTAQPDFGDELNTANGAGAASLVFDRQRGRTLFISTGLATRVWEWDGSSFALRTCSASPPARRGAAIGYDPGRNRAVVFGGEALPFSAAPGTEVLELDPVACAWTVRPSGPILPASRVDAGSTWDSNRNKLVLFGGRSEQSFVGSAATWEWDVRTGRWQERSIAGPGPRYLPGLAFDPVRDRVVLFGGRNAATSLGDTWEYDPGAARWTNVTPVIGPSARHAASLVYDPERQRTVLIGGETDSARLADVWEWDGSSWHKRDLAVSPSARSGAAGAWAPHQKYAVLFGGTSGDGRSIFLQDTWIWRDGWGLASSATANQAPRKYLVGAPNTPPARAGHSLVIGFTIAGLERQQGLLFGGEGDQGLLGDTWTFSVQSFEWLPQPPGNREPSARTEHALAGMPANGVLLFGGKNAQGSLGDSWTWQNGWLEDFSGTRPPARHSHQLATDGARGKVLLFGGRSDSEILADTWEYDPALPRERSGERWTKLSPRNSPAARFGHRLVFDPVRGRVLLTGGSGADARVFDDVWEFDAAANTWTPLVTSLRMPARAGHVAFFDETQARIVSFGGLAYRRGGEAAISYGDTWSFRTGSGSGTTRGFLSLGMRCVSPTECASGLCVDGYCCNTSCSGQCAACDVPQSEGTCVAARGAPHANRPACGGSGGDCDLQCDGVDATACHLPTLGQTCGLASCVAGTVHFPGFCDGQGQCLFSQTQSCEPYACGAGNNCVSRCTTQAECFSSAYFCYRPPFTGPGSCLPFARVVDFSAQPPNPAVGVPVTLRASTNVTFARYLFSYQSGAQRVYPCGTGARDATSCTYTPTAPGAVVWRVEVDAVGSPSTGFDDSRELTVTVGP